MQDLLYDGHLGGHAWITHTDRGALEYFIKNLDIQTMVDVGCGPGGQVELAIELGIDALGVDGDPRIAEGNDLIFECDYTKEKVQFDGMFDLAWSCEFLEHVYEEYMPNYMQTFMGAKYVFATHAPEGEESAACHHVNCKSEQYWIDAFANYGFEYDDKVTQEVRKASTMERDFVRDTGQFFKNVELYQNQ